MLYPCCRAVAHYSDVIMCAMASQITGVSIINSTVCSGADQRKKASLAFVRGNSAVTGEFPSQMASNAENVSVRLMTSSCLSSYTERVTQSLWNEYFKIIDHYIQVGSLKTEMLAYLSPNAGCIKMNISLFNYPPSPFVQVQHVIVINVVISANQSYETKLLHVLSRRT